MINELKFDISFPIKRAYSNERYGLIIIDANYRIHYWDFNGNYDGWAEKTS